MALWEHWRERLDDLIKRNLPKLNYLPEHVKKLSEDEKQAIADSVNNIRRYVKQNYAPTDEDRSKQIEREFQEALVKIEQEMLMYKSIVQTHKRETQKLLDMRKQEDWADLREKVRLFIFRMATGIGIAVVVLATYWLANELEIPMPLRMPSIP